MEKLPKIIIQYLPHEILYKIYEYVDKKNDLFIKRIKEIHYFMFDFILEERFINTLPLQDIYEIMEIYLKKNKNIKLYKDVFNTLKCCNCCKRHKHNVPKNMYDYWDPQDICPFPKNDCKCNCRHVRRLLCSVI